MDRLFHPLDSEAEQILKKENLAISEDIAIDFPEGDDGSDQMERAQLFRAGETSNGSTQERSDGNRRPPRWRSHSAIVGGVATITTMLGLYAYLMHASSNEIDTASDENAMPAHTAIALMPTNQADADPTGSLWSTVALGLTGLGLLFSYLEKTYYSTDSQADRTENIDDARLDKFPDLEDKIHELGDEQYARDNGSAEAAHAMSKLDFSTPINSLGRFILAVIAGSSRVGVSLQSSRPTLNFQDTPAQLDSALGQPDTSLNWMGLQPAGINATSALLHFVPTSPAVRASEVGSSAPVSQIGSSAADLVSDRELEEELRLIDALEIPPLAWITPYGATRNPAFREKRAAAERASIPAPEKKKETIENVFSLEAVNDVNMQREFDEISLKAVKQKSEKEWHDIDDVHRQGIFLVTCIEVISRHLRSHDINTSYRHFYRALRGLWGIAEDVSDDHLSSIVSLLKTDLIDKKWDGQPLSDAGTEKNEAISAYLESRYGEWHINGVGGDTEVLIHTRTDSRVMSIADMLVGKHASLCSDAPCLYHFKSDVSGIEDADLSAFANISKAANIAEWPVSAARNLLEKKYAQMDATPLNFDRAQTIQEIIDEQPLRSATNAEGNKKTAALVIDLINLAVERPAYGIGENSSLVFANAKLFGMPARYRGELNMTELALAEYIYSYTDSYGRWRYDTATLAEYLNSETKTPKIAVASRNHETPLWPKEFTSDFIAYLDKSKNAVNSYRRNFDLSLQLTQARFVLSKMCPDFETVLKNTVTKLCKKATLMKADLDTKMTFKYEEKTINPFSSRPNRSEVKIYTVRDILLGKQRDWVAKNAFYSNEKLTHFQSRFGNRVADRNQKRFVSFLKETDLQNELSRLFETLKNDETYIKAFNHYVSLLESRFPDEQQWRRFMVKENPVMLMYESSNGGFVTLSLLTGERQKYWSKERFFQRMRQSEISAKKWQAHIMYEPNQPYQECEASNLAEKFLSFAEKKIDQKIKSHWEANIDQTFEMIFNFAPAMMVATMGLSLLPALILDSILLGGPKFGQALNSDDEEESKRLMLEGMKLLSRGVEDLFSANSTDELFQLGLSIISRGRSTVRLHVLRADVQSEDSASTKLGNEIVIDCPVRVRRTPGLSTCVASNVSPRNQASGNLVDESESALAKRIRSHIPDWASLGKKLTRALAANRLDKALPLAREKLIDAMVVLKDSRFAEQVTLASKAYFGRDFVFEADVIVGKMESMLADLNKMTRNSFQIETNTQALMQLNRQKYLSWKIRGNEKFINVGVEEFQKYYKHMGKSDQAVADVLLHEISHGPVNTMDYAYIGTRAFDKGNVDVFELINLSNRNFGRNELNQLVMKYPGRSFSEIIQNPERAGNWGVRNADSLTQFISLISKRLRDESAFFNDYHALEEASKASNQFEKRLDIPVLVNRSKRETLVSDAADDDVNDFGILSPYLIVINEDDEISVYRRVDLEGNVLVENV